MKKLHFFSLLFAVALISTSFSGVLPFLADLISIPVNAADEGSSNAVLIIVIIVVVIAAGTGTGLWLFFKKRK